MELQRVKRHSIVILAVDVARLGQLWLVRDHLPEALTTHGRSFPPIRRPFQVPPRATAEALAVPRDREQRPADGGSPKSADVLGDGHQPLARFSSSGATMLGIAA
jgi:hypothetical protein